MKVNQLLSVKDQQEKKKKNYNNSKSQISLSAFYSPEAKNKIKINSNLDISRSMHITFNFSSQNIERVSCVNIRDYKNLVDLDLSNNKLSQPQPELLLLQGLKTLNLSNNGIVKMYALSPKLEVLNISNNQIKDLSFVLPQLSNLQKLDISHNLLTALNHLSGNKTELEELEAHHNQIEDLEGLETMVNLMKFDVSFNLLKQLKHIQYIRDLQRLTFLDFQENPILENKSEKQQLNKVIPRYLQLKDQGVYCASTIIANQILPLQIDSEEQIQRQLNSGNFDFSIENERQETEKLNQKVNYLQQKLKDSEDLIQKLQQEKQNLQLSQQKNDLVQQPKEGQYDNSNLQSVIQKNAKNLIEKNKLQKELNKAKTQIKQHEAIQEMVQQFIGKEFTLDQVEQMRQEFQAKIQSLSSQKSQRNSNSFREQNKHSFRQQEKEQANQNQVNRNERFNQQKGSFQELSQEYDLLCKQNDQLEQDNQKYKKLYSDLKQEYDRLQEEMTETTSNFMDKIRQVELQIANSTRVSFQNSGFQSPQNNSLQIDSFQSEGLQANQKISSQQKIIQYVQHLKERNKKYKDVIKKLLEQRDQLKEQLWGVQDAFSKKQGHEIQKPSEKLKNNVEIPKLKLKQMQ